MLKGELEGFDIELGNAICKAGNFSCHWVESSFDALIPALQAKKFDAINSAMNITEARARSIAFTQPIYRIPTMLVAKTGGKSGTDRRRSEGQEHRCITGIHPGNLCERSTGSRRV
ncbi:Lysine-arginine-ornithine-binding periplasmic protein precursor [Pantoea agglomerans]|uniref:Lysine-arginine-ornithine-binding periplasmic protein n=1 Tax=Enterobacter agglomerans TaxID=549 RepID=A0A379AFS5_ENTAG|nr:Lysine-arginine-ornithine-binding periplasmic protein precursor [Pantoea agglomerans]